MLRIIRGEFSNGRNWTCRGGLGVHRADPPLNNLYKHKRIINCFETGMWMHCRASPEYTFSNPDQHMQDHIYTLRQWLKHAPYWLLCTFSFGLIYYIVTGYRPSGYRL